MGNIILIIKIIYVNHVIKDVILVMGQGLISVIHVVSLMMDY